MAQSAASVAKIPPPQNLEAERSILGAVLNDNRALDSVVAPTVDLHAGDFFFDHHHKIFQAMLDMREQKISPITLVTLCDFLQSRRQLQSVEGAPYISGLGDGLPQLLDLAHYAKIVKQKAALRRVIRLGESLQEKALDPTADAGDVLRHAELFVAEAARNGNGNGNGHGPIGSSLMDFLKMEFPPAEHLVEELIPRGGSVLIVALPHRMKSFFTTALALACTQKTDKALGRLRVERPVRTMLVQVEDHESTVQKRIGDFMRTSQFLDCDATNVWIVKRRDFPGFTRAWLKQFIQQAKEWHADLIILDVLRRIFQGFGDINSPKDSAAFLEMVDEIRNETGATVVLVHHENKKDAELMNAAAGSYNFPGWANVVIQFKRKTVLADGKVTHVEIEVDNKLGVSAEPMRMVLDLSSSVPVQLESLEDGVGISVAIRRLNDSWTVRDLAEVLDVNKSNAYRRLEKWCQKKLCRRVEGGKKGPHGGLARYEFVTHLPGGEEDE